MKKRSILSCLRLLYGVACSALAALLVGSLLLCAFLSSGCANIVAHSESGAEPAGVYPGTRDSSAAVVQIFTEKPEWHSGSEDEASIAHGLCLLFSPFILVDWPLEVVADTITFPYDLYMEVTK